MSGQSALRSSHVHVPHAGMFSRVQLQRFGQACPSTVCIVSRQRGPQNSGKVQSRSRRW